MPKPRNRWDDPKAIRRKDFSQGAVALGMSPAENLAETLFCQDLSEAYNRKRNRAHRAVHHARIDAKGLKIPDISFFTEGLTAEVVIEVDEHKSKAQAIKKARNAIEKHGILEAFVHCLDTGQWLRVEPTPAGIAGPTVQTSFSDVLGIDLGKLTK